MTLEPGDIVDFGSRDADRFRIYFEDRATDMRDCQHRFVTISTKRVNTFSMRNIPKKIKVIGNIFESLEEALPK